MTKAREPRRQVMLPARMRVDGQWFDVRIRNVSSRGLMAQAEAAPARGTYVEIRRADQVVIGRTVWKRDDRFGIRTQDRLDVEALLSAKPGNTRRTPRSPGDSRQATRVATTVRTAEHSRFWSSRMQFFLLVGAGLVAAYFAASTGSAVLRRSIDQISAHLPK